MERRKQGIQPCLPGAEWDHIWDVKMELYKEP